MYIFTVAWRHLRTRSISWVAIALIAVVVVLYLSIISVLEGFKAHYMDKIQGVLSHSTISVGDLSWGIQRPETWAKEIEKLDSGIRKVNIGIETPAMALFDKYRTIGTLRGIDLSDELEYGRLKEMLYPPPLKESLKEFGVHAQGGKDLQGCIVGGAWRKSYGLKVGDRVTFVFTAEETQNEETPRSIAFAIIGFFETDDAYLENGAYIDRKFLAKQMQVLGCAKTLYVWLKDPNRPDLIDLRDRMKKTIQEEIVRLGPTYAEQVKLVSALTWKEKDNKLYEAISNENTVMRFIMSIFLALVTFIIFLIFGRLVAEKIRDIGALRAMGATPFGICSCFLVQSIFVGLLGLGCGLTVALLLNPRLNHIARWIGINLYPSDSLSASYIPTLVLPYDVILISILTILAAVLGALLPAWRAARMDPVECLRHE